MDTKINHASLATPTPTLPRSLPTILFEKKCTPKVKDESESARLALTQNRRLSIRDERLLQIFASQPDQPLVETTAAAAASDSSNDSFICNNRLTTTDKRLIITHPRDENSSPNRILSKINDLTIGDKVREEYISDDNSQRRPVTPLNVMITSNLNGTPQDFHPFMLRIQRDLNSPSATTRIRALKALRSPTKSTYANFDIPHEEQDIITEEERKEKENPKSIQELMKDVVVYVEVRTGEDNRSAGVKKVISALGAKVNDKLLKGTTHVVFKDGLQSTYNKAKKWNIPIVSILWIEACKNHRKIVNPKSFPISNADRYENPELYDRLKRHKSMQPDAEEHRRIRTKVLTPKKIPPTTNSKKTDFDSFVFKSNGKNKKTNSPPAQLPARKCENSNNEKESIETQQTHNICEDVNNTNQPIPDSRISTRRSSFMQTSSSNGQNETLLRRSRRRSMNIYSSGNMSLITEGRPLPNESQTIVEEEEKINLADTQTSSSTKEISLSLNQLEMINPPDLDRRTIFTPKRMELTPTTGKLPSNNSSYSKGERTIATPTPIRSLLEEHASTIRYDSSKSPSKSSRRRTLFDVSMDIISQRLQNINQSAKSNRSSLSNGIISKASLADECRLRMCGTGTPTVPADARKELFTEVEVTERTTPNLISTTTTTTKKRKLFDPNDIFSLTSSGESVNADSEILQSAKKRSRQTLIPKSSSSPTRNERTQTRKKKTTNVSRRSTMIFQTVPKEKNLVKSAIFNGNKTADVKSNSVAVSNSDKERKMPSLVYTNMHKEEITVVEEAVTKIGNFHIEDTVSDNTTHVVSLEPRRTLNILRAIARGLWIVNYKWITDSLSKGCWLDEEQYELKEISRAVEICRSERQAFGSDYKIDLFSDLGPMYISSKSFPITKANLVELVRLCSGKIVNQRTRAKYIIGDRIIGKSEKINLNPYWVIDSITSNKVQKFSKYSPTSSRPVCDANSKTNSEILSQQF